MSVIAATHELNSRIDHLNMDGIKPQTQSPSEQSTLPSVPIINNSNLYTTYNNIKPLTRVRTETNNVLKPKQVFTLTFNLFGRKFYSFLKKQKDPNTIHLLGSESITHQSLILFINNGERKGYTIFNSDNAYTEFYFWYDKIPTDKRNFFEVIYGPQKVHFDIDGAREKLTDPSTLITDGIAARDAVIWGINEVMKDFNIRYSQEQSLLVTESNGPDKQSYHITVNHHCVSDNKEAEAFYHLVMNKIKGRYNPQIIIDSSVYKDGQQFRLIGSQKAGSNRPKRPIPEFTPKLESPLDQLFAYLVGFTSGCTLLPSFNFTKPKKPLSTNNTNDTNDTSITAHEEDQAIALFNAQKYSKYFERQTGSSDKFISFRRIIQGKCPVLQHPNGHKHNGCFLTITKYGAVYYNCHSKNPPAKGIRIGYIIREGSVTNIPVINYRIDTNNFDSDDFDSDDFDSDDFASDNKITGMLPIDDDPCDFFGNYCMNHNKEYPHEKINQKPVIDNINSLVPIVPNESILLMMNDDAFLSNNDKVKPVNYQQRVPAHAIINGGITNEKLLINPSPLVGKCDKSKDATRCPDPIDINKISTLQFPFGPLGSNNILTNGNQTFPLNQYINNDKVIIAPKILINPSQSVGQIKLPTTINQTLPVNQVNNANNNIVASKILINLSQPVGQIKLPTTITQTLPVNQVNNANNNIVASKILINPLQSMGQIKVPTTITQTLPVNQQGQKLDININKPPETQLSLANGDDLEMFIRTYISKCPGEKMFMENVDNNYKQYLIQNNKRCQYLRVDEFNRAIYKLLQTKPLRKGEAQRRYVLGFTLEHVADPNTAVPRDVIPPAMMLPQNQSTGCFSKPALSEAEIYQAKWNKYFIPKLRGNHEVDHSPTLRQISQIVGNLNRYALIMKAVCGTGKTINIVREIARNPNAKILVVCGKRALGRKQLDDFRELNFEYYLDKGKGLLRNISKLVVQIDSLWKVVDCDYDYLILDEFTYTQDQLVTFTQNKGGCVDALVEWISDTPKVIVADAFIEENTVDFIRNLRPDLHIYENDFPKQSDKTVFVVQDEGTLLRYIYIAIYQKKKIIIPCGSKEDVKALALEIKRRFPDLIIKSYTSDTILDIDPVTEWRDADIVIFTSVCEAGNSFVLEHFSKCFGKFTAMSFTPESAAQMIFRSRFLFDNEIYIYVSNRRKPEFPEDIKNIQQMKTFLQRKDIFAREELFGVIPVSRRQNTLDVTHPYFHMFADVKLRKHLGMMKFEDRLLNLLKSQGVKFGNVIEHEKKMEKYEKELVSEHHNNKVIIKFYEYTAIAESEIINPDKANEIAGNERATIEEKNSLKKYNLMSRFQLATINASFVWDTINRTFQHRNITACSELSVVPLNDEKEKLQIMTDIQYKFIHDDDEVGEVIHVTERMKNTDRLMNYKHCMRLIDILRQLGIQDFIKGGFITRQQFQQSYSIIEHQYALLQVNDFNQIIALFDSLLGIKVINLDVLRQKKSPILNIDDINDPIRDKNNLYEIGCFWKKADDRNLLIPVYMSQCELKSPAHPIPQINPDQKTLADLQEQFDKLLNQDEKKVPLQQEINHYLYNVTLKPTHKDHQITARAGKIKQLNKMIQEKEKMRSSGENEEQQRLNDIAKMKLQVDCLEKNLQLLHPNEAPVVLHRELSKSSQINVVNGLNEKSVKLPVPTPPKVTPVIIPTPQKRCQAKAIYYNPLWKTTAQAPIRVKD